MDSSANNASTDGDPLPLAVRQSKLWQWATPALSVAILLVVVWQFRTLHITEVLSAVPGNPAFWICFALYYCIGILADFIIFRRLWNLPFEGLIALTRKSVSNALLVDYIGEAYFYSWARKKVKMETSPFGAVKDVAILSALVSNIVTLVMMAMAYPFYEYLDFGVTGSAVAASVGVIVVISTLVFVFGKRLFSLTKPQLWWIAGIHSVRLILSNVLLALCWSLALPDVSLGWWLVLSTSRMLLGRLPLFTNGDVVFAGLVVFLIGTDTEIKLLMALMAALALLTHLVVGAVLAIGDLVTVNRDPKEEVV